MMWDALVTNATTENVRTVVEGGRTWLVAPAAIMPHGVMSGSKGPLYYPARESERTHKAWDRVPITVLHPFDPVTGQPLAANDDGVKERQEVGETRNPTYDGKTRVEAWFDEEKVRNKSPETWRALKRDEQIPLSTGLYTDNIPRAGSFNGVPYVAEALNHRPDHLAVLPGGRGACHIDDGCGVNVTNAAGDDDIEWITMGGVHVPIKGGKFAAGPFKGKSVQEQAEAGGHKHTSKDSVIREMQAREFLSGKKHEGSKVPPERAKALAEVREKHKVGDEFNHPEYGRVRLTESGIEPVDRESMKRNAATCNCGGTYNSAGVCNMCGAKATGERAQNAWTDEAREAAAAARAASRAAHSATKSGHDATTAKLEKHELGSSPGMKELEKFTDSAKASSARGAFQAAAQRHAHVAWMHTKVDEHDKAELHTKAHDANIAAAKAVGKYGMKYNEAFDEEAALNADPWSPENAFGEQPSPVELWAESEKQRKLAQDCLASDDHDGYKEHTALADAAAKYAGGAELAAISQRALDTGLSKDHQAAADANRAAAANAAKLGDGKGYELHSQAAAEHESAATIPQTANSLWAKFWALVKNAPQNSPVDGRFMAAKQVAAHHVKAGFKKAHPKTDLPPEKPAEAAVSPENPNKPEEPEQVDALGIPIKTHNREWTQKDRDELEPWSFAGPNQSYPIETQADLDAAVQALGRAPDPDAVKAGIKRIAAKRKLKLPDAWVENSNPTGINQYTKGAAAAREATAKATAATEKAGNAFAKGPKAMIHVRSAGIAAGNADSSSKETETPRDTSRHAIPQADWHDVAAMHHNNAAFAHETEALKGKKGLGDPIAHAEAMQAHKDAAAAHTLAAQLGGSSGRFKGGDYRSLARNSEVLMAQTEDLAVLTANCSCEADRAALNNLSDGMLASLAKRVANKDFTSDEERKAAFAHMADGGDESKSASEASARAEKLGSVKSHRAAAAAHKDAAEHHRGEGNSDEAKSHSAAAGYHTAKANAMTKNAAKKRDEEDDEEGDEDYDDEETMNQLNPKQLVDAFGRLGKIERLTANVRDKAQREALVANLLTKSEKYLDRQLEFLSALTGNALQPAPTLPLFGAYTQPTAPEPVNNSEPYQEAKMDYTENASPALLARLKGA